MKYTITGSLGHISKPLTIQLLQAGHQVTVISSNSDRKTDIEELGATAAIGSVEDTDFLTNAFAGADAVYTMVPPTTSAPNWREYIRGIGHNFASAIKAAGVKYVVNLSSAGAHLPEGCGPVSGIHYVELALNDLDGVAVKHLRPGFFYYNFLNNAGMAKHLGFIGGNYGSDTTMVLTDPEDIAKVAAEELLNLAFNGKSIRYIVSDERSNREVAAVLGRAIGKPDLPWVDFTDQDTFGAMVQNGLPEDVAQNYTEMGASIRTGTMFEEYIQHKPTEFGKTKLEDFAPAFAQAYEKA